MKELIERIKEMFEDVTRLKGSAHTNREFADYEGAISDLDKAIYQLDLAESLLTASSPEDQDWYEETKLNIATEHADVYGMKGGIYRRLERLRDALKMYEKGSEYERNFNIQATYNRTNVIVLTLLESPNEYDKLREDLEKTRAILEEQVSLENNNNWWAWADFGLVNLLLVHFQDPDKSMYYEEKANDAYEQFKANGAGVQHVESTIKVLKELEKKIGEFDERTGALIGKTISALKKPKDSRD